MLTTSLPTTSLSAPGCDLLDDASPAPLPVTQSLRGLLAALVAVRDRAQAPAAAEGEDDDYLYLELDLPGRSTGEIDVCVHDGRAFVRVAR
jgi:hypothetical protein